MTTALDFSDIDGGMLAEVGGKAANLGELTRAGLPVPPGWALTTEAYHEVAQAAGLDDVIATGGPGLAEAARTRLLAAPIPEAVARSIREAYTTLSQTAHQDAAPVAVRSSATAEDLPFASFAGQQDTYLNVVGADAVLDAVRRCWASLWTDRAVAYRAANGIDHAAVRLAVVVQRMVDAAVGRRAVHRQPGHRAAAPRPSSTPAPGSARRWSPAPSTPTTSWSTPRPARSSSGGSATSGWRSGRCPAAAPSTSSRDADDAPA